jgi:thymidylate synthase (FAD)
MTLQTDVINDPNYLSILNHGFVGLIDHMGSDHAVVQAARTSYGQGTKSVRQDRGLIRYLMKHKHTSPFEMNTVKLHLKIPIFVMRQLVRHRTSSLNEYSGRYSEMTDEFYIPDLTQIKPQSKDNKQGRSGELSESDALIIQTLIEASNDNSYAMYKTFLGSDKLDTDLSDDFEGIARELARVVLPVSNYTELYWSQNLHNMFHLLKLRMDPHAQYEIRVVAQAIYDLIQPLFPMCVEAFDDYILNSISVSKHEQSLLTELINYSNEFDVGLRSAYLTIHDKFNNHDDFLNHYNLSSREFTEFENQWNVT